MATIAENKFYYDNFDWRYSGEFWANRWGGSEMQWFGTILPRIHALLPAPVILEIGPGQGRISRFLETFCERLYLVDFCEECVEGCKKRLGSSPKVECFLNDGRSLGDIPDGSVDFGFSFFSLVHADHETISGYLTDLARALKPTGMAFLHHSNAGECLTGDDGEDTEMHDYRDTSVDAASFAALASQARLTVRSQELFAWEEDMPMTDCFSIVGRAALRIGESAKLFRNSRFPEEVKRLRELSAAYAV